MYSQSLPTPHSEMACTHEGLAPIRQFSINRGPLKPGYDIQTEEKEKRKYYAEMDFETRCVKGFHKLSLRSLDEEAPTIAVSFMPWPSRNICVGFTVSNKLQEEYWEGMEKMKYRKQEPDRQEYRWVTTFRDEQTTVLWRTKSTCPARRRNYTLLDQKTSQVLAEFHSDKTVYMGGMLKIHDTYGLGFEDFDRKSMHPAILMLRRIMRALYETEYVVAVELLIHHARLTVKEMSKYLPLTQLELSVICSELVAASLVTSQADEASGKLYYFIDPDLVVDSVRNHLSNIYTTINRKSEYVEENTMHCLQCKKNGREHLWSLENLDFPNGQEPFRCGRCHATLQLVPIAVSSESAAVSKVRNDLNYFFNLLRDVDKASMSMSHEEVE